MMNNLLRNKLPISIALTAILGFTSCSDDDEAINLNNNDKDKKGASELYVIAAESESNSYMLTTEDLTEGQVSIKGNGLQVVGTDLRWFFYKDELAYAFVYRQGDPGTTQSFLLDEQGEMQSQSELDLQVSMQTKGIIGEDLYMQYSSRNYEEPVSTFYKINAKTQAVQGPIQIDTKQLANNGEYAYITDIAAYNDQVLISYRTIKAGENGSDNRFDSDFNDHTYLAVLNQNLELQYRIEDTGRTGVVAGQSRSQGETGIEVVENGDVYVFSSALDAPEVPSGILKINDGETEFAQDYFFNISEASEGYKLYRTYYVGENTFVLRMFSEKNIASASPGKARNKFAVVNVVDKTFKWFSGVPENIQATGEPYVDAANNEVVFPIETDGYPRLYSFDATNATVTAGVEVVAENVKAIGKLSK